MDSSLRNIISEPTVSLKFIACNSSPFAGTVVHFSEAEADSRPGGALTVAWLGQCRQDHYAETAGSGRCQPHHPYTSTTIFQSNRFSNNVVIRHLEERVKNIRDLCRLSSGLQRKDGPVRWFQVECLGHWRSAQDPSLLEELF